MLTSFKIFTDRNTDIEVVKKSQYGYRDEKIVFRSPATMPGGSTKTVVFKMTPFFFKSKNELNFKGTMLICLFVFLIAERVLFIFLLRFFIWIEQFLIFPKNSNLILLFP